MNFFRTALFHANSKVCVIYFGQDCRTVKYRDYKSFESKAFNNKFQVRFKNLDISNFSFIELRTKFMELLNKVAPLKTEYLRAGYS